MSNNGIDGYRDFLKRRDGEADLLNRRLANREDFFNSIETEAVRSACPADRPTFLLSSLKTAACPISISNV